MINTRLLKTTLMAASAAIALTAAPAWADDETTTAWSDGDGVAVGDGTGSYTSAVNSYDEDISISYGDEFTGINASNAKTITDDGTSGEGYQGSWLIFLDDDASDGTNAIPYTVSGNISGNGFLGIAVKVGAGGTTGTVDLTEASAVSFSGQLMVLNVWNNSFTVKLGGSDWANTEYVFSGVSREWWDKASSADASTSSTNTGDFYALAGTGNSASDHEVETLELSSDTSLAGVSGTSEGYTYTKTDADGNTTISIDFNSREAITAASSGTTLTLTGSGTDVEYAFYGTVGSSSIALDIAKTGTATQIFGGTNYLGNVSVTGGELVLGTLSVTAGDTTISGSGTISITDVTIGSGRTERTLTIGTADSATTVTAGSVSVSGHTTIDVASGSVLEVTGDLADSSGYVTAITGDGKLSAGSMTLSPNNTSNAMTISVAELEVSGELTLTSSSVAPVTISSTTATIGSISNSGTGTFEITSANLNIGSGGITGNEVEITDTTVGLSSGTSSATISAGLWLNGTTTGTTFNATEGQEMTLSGAMTGNGALVKTGDGTLTISGDNSYYGGATISAGTVVASSSSALGTGDVTIASGATLDIEVAITIGQDNDGKTITFNTGSLLVIGESLLASAVVESDDTEVATVADTATAVEIISASAIVFGDTTLSDGDVSDLVNGFVSSDITSAYDLTWTYADGSLAVSATETPEPSMFGLLAGLGALGLVATRRRRNRKA